MTDPLWSFHFTHDSLFRGVLPGVQAAAPLCLRAGVRDGRYAHLCAQKALLHSIYPIPYPIAPPDPIDPTPRHATSRPTTGKMFKLILRYTFVGLFVAQFVMFVMLVTKLAYEDMPFFLPLPIVTYFAKDLISKWCVVVLRPMAGPLAGRRTDRPPALMHSPTPTR